MYRSIEPSIDQKIVVSLNSSMKINVKKARFGVALIVGAFGFGFVHPAIAAIENAVSWQSLQGWIGVVSGLVIPFLLYWLNGLNQSRKQMFEEIGQVLSEVEEIEVRLNERHNTLIEDLFEMNRHVSEVYARRADLQREADRLQGFVTPLLRLVKVE